jgi:hypothetical protein
MKLSIMSISAVLLILTCSSCGKEETMSKTDPLIGTWKLDAAKGNYWALQQTTVKELTGSYRGLGNGQIDVTVTGTREDGSPISLKGTFPRQGGGKITDDGMSYVVTVIDLYRFYLTILQNGKQVLVYESKISKDGKTKRDWFKGIDSTGKFYEGVEVSDKQH